MEPPAQKLVHCLREHLQAVSMESSVNVPAIVLRVEEEVGADNCDTDCDDYHDDIDQQHEPKDIVDLVLPE